MDMLIDVALVGIIAVVFSLFIKHRLGIFDKDPYD